MPLTEWDEGDEGRKRIGLRPPSKDGKFQKPSKQEVEGDRKLELRSYGPIQQQTLEAMCVAKLLAAEHDDKLAKAMGVELDREAEDIVSSAIREEWFENRFLGSVYWELRELYVKNGRKRIRFDNVRLRLYDQSNTADQGEMYVDELRECHAALISRQARSSFMVSRMAIRYRNRLAEKAWKTFLDERKNPNIGSEKALENFRTTVMRELTDRSEAAIQESDWIEDYESSMSKLVDMKMYPEKYMGYKCGIRAFDDKTKGFRPGHLTVLVGMHGGFKTTTMLNIAYGLWGNGYEVLYVSLEMESFMVEVKLWCRAAGGKVSLKKVYGGQISENEDRERLRVAMEKLQDSSLTDSERKELSRQVEIYKNSLVGIEQSGDTDKSIFEAFYLQQQERQNRIKIINAGQSHKVKCSQIERWLEDNRDKFRPHVVILDYLDMLAPETAYPDRRDQEMGDICKYVRQMGLKRGFAAISAAQFKRPALERIREAGFERIEKAQVGTDDIAGSNQIGADADEVFMLFRQAGGTKLKVLTPKARYAEADVEKGTTLQVNPDACMIDDGGLIEDIAERARNSTPQEAFEALRDIHEQEKALKTVDDDPAHESPFCRRASYPDEDMFEEDLGKIEGTKPEADVPDDKDLDL